MRPYRAWQRVSPARVSRADSVQHLPHYDGLCGFPQIKSTNARNSPLLSEACRGRSERGPVLRFLDGETEQIPLVTAVFTPLLSRPSRSGPGPASQLLDVFAHDHRKRLGALDGRKDVLWCIPIFRQRPHTCRKSPLARFRRR